MENYIREDELMHYGRKGMKWGQSIFGKKRTPKSDDYVRAKQLKKKKLSQLSNAELKELNNRMQLESNYRNLKKQNVSMGKKFVQDVLYESGKNLASEQVKKYAKKGGVYVATRIFMRGV